MLMPFPNQPPPAHDGPVLQWDDERFTRWHARKLAACARRVADCMVEIGNPHRLSPGERQRINRVVDANNFFGYQLPQGCPASDGFLALGRQLGLGNIVPNPASDATGVSTIRATAGRAANIRDYVPYSNQALGWHTDGCYNAEADKVRAFILHCEQPAQTGGENQLIDHELLYAYLRATDPELTRALCADNCLTIPGNAEPGIAYRRAPFAGAVFSIDQPTGALYMRFTGRKKTVQWNNDATLGQALASVNAVLDSSVLPIITLRLEAGQGIICNNVMHNRSAFTDSNDEAQTRRLYRVRFRDRIDTGVHL